MRTRSSGSADEDDSDEAIVANPCPSQHDDRTRTSASAKFIVKGKSVTLERRKIERTSGVDNGALEPGTLSEQDRQPGIVHQSMAKMDLPIKARPRSRSPWRCTLLTLGTTLLSVALLVAIVRSFFTRQLDPKGCKICWMIPDSYVRMLDFDTEYTRLASKYSLYLYREQGDEDTMVRGVPVLFITGNAGSYKQVRFLAAEAARYFAEHVQHDTEAISKGVSSLDFFSADFNEDFTAFHGQTLLDQAEYLNEAVAYILSLYHNPNRSRRDPGLPDPSSVIIIGHSMGGIVARTMLNMTNYRANSINTMITMSTPHARAPISFDPDIVSTYAMINDYWREAYSQTWASDNPLWHVTLVSVAGGGLDTVVPSDYASIASLVPDTHGFTVFTSTVPNVWTGSDHLSILWCDQFRKVIARSLLDAVDARRPSQTKPRAERMRVFKKWYLTGMESTAERSLPQKEPTTLLTLEDNSNSIMAVGERLVLRGLGSSRKPEAYLMPIPAMGAPGTKRFTLLSDQILDPPGGHGQLEVLVCSVFPLHPGQSATVFSMDMDLSGDTFGSTRLACKNAASDVIALPASKGISKFSFDDSQPFSYLQYEFEDISEHQFVAVVDKSKSPANGGWVLAQFADRAHSQIETNLGLWGLLTRGLRMKLSADRPLTTDIRIPAVHSSLLAYRFSVGSHACGDLTPLFMPLLRQYILEPFESKYFVNVKEAEISLHGIAPFMPSPLRAQAITNGVNLQLWSDPTCNTPIEISLQVDLIGSLGKLWMRYRTVIPAIPLFIIALVLRKQFSIHDHSGVFITFMEAMDLCLRSSLPLILLAMTFLAMSLANSYNHAIASRSSDLLNWRQNSTESALDYTKNDLLFGSQDPFFWFLVPLFGVIGVGLCVVVNYAALALVSTLSVVYSTVVSAPSWLKNGNSRRDGAPIFAAASPRRRVITTCVLLFLVATIVPYPFAYMVACLVQIATCTRALRFAGETRSGSHYNFYNYAHSVLVLMLWVLPINVLVLVVWVHNLAVHWLTPFSSHHNVLSIMPFILLVETLTSGKMIPRITSRFRIVTNVLFFILAVYAIIYGATYAYRLHHLANVICAWLVAVHSSEYNISLSSLTQMLEGISDDRLKKRP